MFKAVYKISRWDGKKTFFHKNYYVFDGLGLMFFNSLSEARSYVKIKSTQLKNIFNQSKSYYLAFTRTYLDRVLKFRINENNSTVINDGLVEVLSCYKYLSRPIFPQYSISKIRRILEILIDVSIVLNLRLMRLAIQETIDSFFLDYPVYNSNDNINKVEINHLQNSYVRKCII